MKNRQAVLNLLDAGLSKLAEVKPRDSGSTKRLAEAKDKIRSAKAKVAEEPEDAPAPTPSPTPTPEPTPPPLTTPSPIYIGAYIKEGRTGGTVPWNDAYWTTFEQLSGCDMALIHFGMKWGEFYASTLELCAKRGSVPLLDAMPPSGVSLREILEGKQDAAIAQMASALRTYGKPVLFRPLWEMNGDWYEWGRDPDYVAAWRYLHERMDAPHVSWAYCPNAVYDDASRASLFGMYPGDSLVDWLGFDTYNRGTNPAKPDRWKKPGEILGQTYTALQTLAPTKPILIGETASTEIGGDKAAWITEMFKVLPNYPAIRAFCWFNWEIYENGGWMDWPVTTTPAAQAAWKAALANPYFRAAPNASATGQKLIVP